jgi:hypothetical protein
MSIFDSSNAVLVKTSNYIKAKIKLDQVFEHDFTVFEDWNKNNRIKLHFSKNKRKCIEL